MDALPHENIQLGKNSQGVVYEASPIQQISGQVVDLSNQRYSQSVSREGQEIANNANNRVVREVSNTSNGTNRLQTSLANPAKTNQLIERIAELSRQRKVSGVEPNPIIEAIINPKPISQTSN